MTESRSGRRAGVTTRAATALLLLTRCTGCDPGGRGHRLGPISSGEFTGRCDHRSGQCRPDESCGTYRLARPEEDNDARVQAAPEPRVLAASAPVSLAIPAIGTGSELLHLGLRENGSLEVPPEGPGAPASWYDGSPAPGERGPAVLLGHVNATGGGPGVFADLRQLKPGDRIEVARADGSTAVFTVDRGQAYAKEDFPTLEVYGNTAGAELRLITCDGYDPATGEFDDNYVVYASLKA